ncbi:MAG: sigma-70 family RNA polymerase sigma factor [Verrucomicrobiota bacterium]
MEDSAKTGSATTRLTSAMSQGDNAAWHQFQSQYESRIRAYLSTCLQGNHSHLDDLLQETLIRVSKYVRTFHEEEAFWSWLTVLSRSALADHGRRRSTWHQFLDRYRNHQKERLFLSTSTSEDINQALTQLDDFSRQLLEEKYFEGIRIRSLAQRHQRSEKAIEHLLAKARRKLARILKKQHSKNHA